MGMFGEKRMTQITLTPELNKSLWMRIAIYAILFVIIFLTFYGDVTPTRYDLKVGDVAPLDIYAATDAIDTRQTELAREEADRKVAKQYQMDPTVEDKALTDLNKLFDLVQKLILDSSSDKDKKMQAFKEQSPFSLSEDITKTLLQYPVDKLKDLRNESNRLASSFLSTNFTDESMANAGTVLDTKLVKLDMDKDSRLIVRAAVLASLKPNMIYNYKATEDARQEARKQVGEVRIQKGDLIVKKGDVINDTILSELRDLKVLSQSPNYKLYVGLGGLILAALLIMETYLHITKSPAANQNNLLLLIAIIMITTVIAIKTVALGYQLNVQSIGYLAPVALGTMLLTILFDAQLGIVGVIVFTLLAAIPFGFKFQFLFVNILSALAGTFAVARVQHRLVLMRSAFIIAGVNMLAIGAVQSLLTSTDLTWRAFMQTLLFGLVNGILSGILAIGVLPFLESTFGILTPVSLLELSNPNHPLLRKLLMEAPGTYHHSLIVGNLAESAAEVIGANPLLCRVGAYFHDVGKSKRPLFFIENQLSKDNPHDKVAPSLSHLIITSHVKDGVEMQEQHRLPKPIREICEQHHGTTILWFFYNKALELDKNSPPKVDDFRYPCPKPQSKEAAIVMLCDSVEAAVRSMNRPTPNRIEAVIRKIMKDRLNDGQLDECDLTLKDLDKMADAFMRTLSGIYHNRIEYPDPPKQA